MHLVNGAELRLPPFKCLVTGRIDGPVVDFNVAPVCDQPPNVAILLVKIEEAAEEFGGMVKRSKVEKLEEDMARMAKDLEDTQRIIKATEELESLLPDKEAIHA